MSSQVVDRELDAPDHRRVSGEIATEVGQERPHRAAQLDEQRGDVRWSEQRGQRGLGGLSRATTRYSICLGAGSSPIGLPDFSSNSRLTQIGALK